MRSGLSPKNCDRAGVEAAMRSFVASAVPAAVLLLGCDGAAFRADLHANSRSATATAPGATTASPVRCEDRVSLHLPHVTVSEAHVVAAGSPKAGAPSLPAHCRVLGISRPGARLRDPLRGRRARG